MTNESATRFESFQTSRGVTGLARDNPRRLLGIAGTGFIGGMAEALFLVLIVRSIFSITEEEPRVQLVGDITLDRSTAIFFAAFALSLRVAMAVLTSRQAALLSSNMVAAARHQLVRSYFGAEWAVQQEQPSGSLQEYISSYTSRISTYLGGVALLIMSSANLVALLGVAFALDPVGAGSLIVAITVLSVLLRPVRAALARRALQANAARANLATTVGEYSSLALEFRVFNVVPAAEANLDELTDRSRRQSIRYTFLGGLISPIYSALAYGALLFIIILVFVLNVADFEALGAVMLLVLRSLSYGQALQQSFTSMSSYRPIADEVIDEIVRLEQARQEPGLARVESLNVIEAQDLSFEYERGTPVLTDINFEIHRHEIVGMIGPSGSGKSTLVQLLLGLREPLKGSILVDGIDVRSVDPEYWSRLVTFVPQSPRFLPGTIRDNIRFLRDDVSDEAVEKSSRWAHLYDEILKMPGGFERDVGEAGGHLSGGQQQRLCIARALVESPHLIVLDEPTSALDPRSEDLLRTTLAGLRKQMSVVIVAHRMSTLEICDRIMVIQDGRITAFDSPSNLAESSGFFQESLKYSGLETPRSEG